MWVIGALVFYLFYRFAIVWYLKFWTFSDPLQRPFLWRSGWYHLCVLAASITLLIASAYLFSKSNPWLSIAPLPLLVMSLLVFWIKRGNRISSIISKAVEIQVQMEQQCEPQSKINQAISAATTGDDYTNEHDLKSFLKFSILSREGLIRSSQGLSSSQDVSKYVAELRDIDTLIDSLYKKRKRIAEQQNASLAKPEN